MLQVTSNSFSQLERADQQVLIAKTKDKINVLITEHIELHLLGLIEKVYFNTGYKSNPDDKLALCTNFAAILKSEYQGYSMDEISIALNRGSMGRYGDFTGINPKTFCGWMRAYDQDRIKAEHNLKMQVPPMDRPQKLTGEELVAYQKERYEKLMEYLDQKKEMPLTWGWDAVFAHLRRIKEITDTDEEADMFIENVIAELKEESKAMRTDMQRILFDPAKIINDEKALIRECRKRRVINYLTNKT